ncbi:MAG: hypothetical protein AAB697_02285, partial [Patescibacteria group bacterium]
MLTTEAANALLKTLEEPPAHAVFVLCTTDPEKLPETVVSRCTRVQFKKPSVAEIVSKLKIVVKGEKLEIRNEELELIAKSARGSFRDAIKILEQVSLSDKPAREVLGMLESAEPAKFIKLLSDEDTKGALEFINKMMEEGVSPRSFIERCVEELREQLLETMDKSVLPLIDGLERAYERTKTSAVSQLPLEIFVIEQSGLRAKSQVLSESSPQPLAPIKHGSGKGKFKLEDVQAKWQDVLRAVRPHNHSVEALLRSTKPVECDGDTLLLEVFYKFHKDKLESEKCRQIVEVAVGEVFGTDPVRLVLQLGQRLRPGKEEVVAENVDDDLVAAAAEIFKVEAV